MKTFKQFWVIRAGDDAFQASRERTIAALDSYVIDGVGVLKMEMEVRSVILMGQGNTCHMWASFLPLEN